MLRVISATVATSLLVAMPAYAGSAGHHAGIELLMFPFINFFLYLALLFLLLRRPFPAFLQSRRAAFESAVDKARAQIDDAEAQHSAAEQQLAALPKQIVAMGEESDSVARREAAALVEDSRRKAARIVEQAQRSAEAELRATEVQIRRELAEQVIERSIKQISQSLTAERDRSLRDRAVTDLKELH